MSYQDEPLETEEELRESYPALYGVKEDPYEPPPYKLTVEQQKFLDDQRAKYRARFAANPFLKAAKVNAKREQRLSSISPDGKPGKRRKSP